jgi:hypothetical protein
MKQGERKTVRPSKIIHAWMPARYELSDANAIKALAAGTANEDQQKRALDWIINKACATYDLSYRPGGEDGRRDTDLAEGGRRVGLSIIKLIKTPIEILRGKNV